MIYLDNAATTLMKPPAVYNAVLSAMRTCAGVGRSGHEPAMEAASLVFACRQEAAMLFEAEPEQVVFTMNATHGLNIAIRSLVSTGDHVVISGFEHNAVYRSLFAVGAKVEIAGRSFDRGEILEGFSRAIGNDTAAVVCTHVSNVFGLELPLREIAELCKTRGVPLIVDAAQSAGCLPVSLRDLGAAFLAMPGHKGLYGPQGTGLLICGQVPEPLIYGGTGSLSADPQMPDFLPDRTEAGTHNVPGIAGLLEGLRYVRGRTASAIRDKERRLLQIFRDELTDEAHITLYDGFRQAGVISLRISGVQPEAAAAALSEKGIAVRAGLHCAPLAHETAGTLDGGTVRFSFSDLNTEQDAVRAAQILRRWKEFQ